MESTYTIMKNKGRPLKKSYDPNLLMQELLDIVINTAGGRENGAAYPE